MTTTHPQAGILLPPPPAARHLEFSLAAGATRQEAEAALGRLLASGARVDGISGVLGLGLSAVQLLGLSVPGLRPFPALTGAAVDVPATPRALWLYARGEDRGELVHRTRAIQGALAPAFVVECVVDAFTHDGGRDLTGYTDGTANPQADEATAVAIVAAGSDAAPAGSSFATVQRWEHDLARFASFDKRTRDLTIGRELESNDEIDDAPEAAHVKRTAQEVFDPPAFVVRRSMPWSDAGKAGLVFVAFGESLGRFEALMRRMAGLDDGIVDALFTFTRPVSGATYWCPPVRAGKIAIAGL